MITKFSETTIEKLGEYVYCLCYEQDGAKIPFYIGKGSGNRIFNHEKNLEKDFTSKAYKMDDLIEQGKHIEKYIIYYGLDKNSDISLQCESALISLAEFLNFKLENTQINTNSIGVKSVEEIEHLFSNNAIELNGFEKEDKVVLSIFKFDSQNLFHPFNYESIKNQILQMNIKTTKQRESPKYICVVYRSIIKAIFKIDKSDIETVIYEKSNRQYTHLKIHELSTTDKYKKFIGKSIKEIKVHSSTRNKFTY